MRMVLIGLTAALLSACNGMTAGNNMSTGNAAAASNNSSTAAPPLNQTNMVMPGGEEDAGGGNTSADAAPDRSTLLAGCTAEAGAALPPGTDVARLCGCAVDRAMAGAPRAAAMRQCATEQNVRLPMGQ